MSALRKSLKKPQTWLALFLALLLASVLDTLRPPADQLTGRGYIACVRLYQHWGRPLLAGSVRCRYCPTCSEYSIEAVQKHGIRRGLVLTARRIQSCRTSVPYDTPDPVPDPE
jgi:putative membrane protein insertion efficiency factor